MSGKQVRQIKDTVRAATGQAEEIPRLFIFGPKVGAYAMNMLGQDAYTTVDTWESRFWRSLFKDTPRGTGLESDSPSRQLYKEAGRRLAEKLGMPTSAAQAVRWYYIIQKSKQAGYTKARSNETIAGYVRAEIEKRSFRRSIAGRKPVKAPGRAKAAIARGNRGRGQRSSVRDVLGDTIFAEIGAPDRLSQAGDEGVKAFVDFVSDGKAVMTAVSNPDISSALHELLHVARRQLLSAPGRVITQEDIDTVEKWAGVKDGQWTVNAEEKFARAGEKYLRQGEAPSAKLGELFKKLSTWLHGIYKRLKGSPIDVRITPKVKDVFDKLVTRGLAADSMAVDPKQRIVEIDQEIASIEEGSGPNQSDRLSELDDVRKEAQNEILAERLANGEKYTLVVVGCCDGKKKGRHPARDLYQSDLYKKSRQWAEQNGDEWIIASAKHGRLNPHKYIDWYDQELGGSAEARRVAAGKMNVNSLFPPDAYKEGKIQPDMVKVVLLTSKPYSEAVRTMLSDAVEVEEPMAGMQIGERKSWLKKENSGEAEPAAESPPAPKKKLGPKPVHPVVRNRQGAINRILSESNLYDQRILDGMSDQRLTETYDRYFGEKKETPKPAANYTWEEGANGLQAKGLEGNIRAVKAEDTVMMGSDLMPGDISHYFLDAPHPKTKDYKKGNWKRTRPNPERAYVTLDEAKAALIEANEKYVPKGSGGGSQSGGYAQRMPTTGEMTGFPEDSNRKKDQEAGEQAEPEEPQDQYVPPELDLMPMPLPEMVQMVRKLMGEDASVKKMRRYLGYLKTQEGGHASMAINALIRGDSELLAKVLAHEAGHLIDFLPDRTMARGNILGRIGSLRGYMKHFLEGYKGGQPPLTEKEKRRLRRDAKRALKKGAQIEIEEEIEERFDITPQDVLNIWNSVETSANPDLLRYIKGLSAAEKLSLVKSAFRGELPEDIQRFAKVVKKKTGKKIIQEVDTDATDEEISAKYHEMLMEEVAKRQLLSLEMIKEELVNLTEWWNPYDKRTASANYIRYRNSAPELYAEALSVLLNDPKALAERAPEFYRGFVSYLGEKPEFMKTLFDIQATLKGGADKVAAAREAILKAAFGKGREAMAEARAEREAARMTTDEWIKSVVAEGLLDRTSPSKGLAKEVGLDNAKAAAAFYAMDELAYSENRTYRMLRHLKEDGWDELMDAEISEDDFGQYLFLQRIWHGGQEMKWDETYGAEFPEPKVDRQDRINPQGYTMEEAKKQLDQMQIRLSRKQWEVLEKVAKRFHDIVFESMEAALEHGVVSQKLFDEVIEPNRDYYVTFAIIDYLKDTIGPQMHEQIGTFKDAANPWETTVMKMVSMNRLIELNRAKGAVRNLMKQSFDKEIISEGRPGRGRQPRGDIRPGKDRIMILEDGKATFYQVPAPIARSFKRHDIGVLGRWATLTQSAVYKAFHPLYVTFSPGFLVANPIRDLRRTWKNLAAKSGKWSRDVEKRLIDEGKSPKEARRIAKEQRISLRDVIREFMKARKDATAHITGKETKLVDEMIAHKAFGHSYVDVSAETGDITEVDRLMQQYGVKDLTGERRIGKGPLRAIEGVFDWFGRTLPGRFLEQEGQRQEIATKIAAYRLIGERMKANPKLSKSEQAHVVRRYAGTPDYKQKGVLTPITNALFMYSNVKWQGLLADMEIATGKETAAEWWWRTMLTDIMPTAVTRLALYGAFGGVVKALLENLSDGFDGDDEEKGALEKTLERVSTYYLDQYETIPLASVFGSEGNEDQVKSLIVTIPKDETAKTLSRLFGAAMDAFIGDGERQTAGGAGNEAFSTLKEAFVPTLSPPFDIAAKWSVFLSGGNPDDNFFGKPILSANEYEAGGAIAVSKMVSWTLQKGGVAGQALDSLYHLTPESVRGDVFNPEEMTWTEWALKLPTGINRFFRITNAGIDEQEYAQLAMEDQIGAELRAKLPRGVRQMVSTHNKNTRLDQSDWPPGRVREAEVLYQRWYYDSYIPGIREAKAAEERGEDPDPIIEEIEAAARVADSAAEKARAKPNAWDADLDSEERAMVAEAIAKIAAKVSGPRRLGPSNRDDVKAAGNMLLQFGLSAGQITSLLRRQLSRQGLKDDTIDRHVEDFRIRWRALGKDD